MSHKTENKNVWWMELAQDRVHWPVLILAVFSLRVTRPERQFSIVSHESSRHTCYSIMTGRHAVGKLWEGGRQQEPTCSPTAGKLSTVLIPFLARRRRCRRQSRVSLRRTPSNGTPHRLQLKPISGACAKGVEVILHTFLISIRGKNGQFHVLTAPPSISAYILSIVSRV